MVLLYIIIYTGIYMPVFVCQIYKYHLKHITVIFLIQLYNTTVCNPIYNVNSANSTINSIISSIMNRPVFQPQCLTPFFLKFQNKRFILFFDNKDGG